MTNSSNSGADEYPRGNFEGAFDNECTPEGIKGPQQFSNALRVSDGRQVFGLGSGDSAPQVRAWVAFSPPRSNGVAEALADLALDLVGGVPVHILEAVM